MLTVLQLRLIVGCGGSGDVLCGWCRFRSGLDISEGSRGFLLEEGVELPLRSPRGPGRGGGSRWLDRNGRTCTPGSSAGLLLPPGGHTGAFGSAGLLPGRRRRRRARAWGRRCPRGSGGRSCAGLDGGGRDPGARAVPSHRRVEGLREVVVG